MKLISIATLLSTAGATLGNPAEKLALCTHKLFNESSTATCFLLHEAAAPEKKYLATAAHVLEKTSGESAVLVLRKEAGGRYQRHDHQIAIRKGDAPLWTRHPELDLAVLPLPASPDAPLRSMPTSALATDELLRESGVTVCSEVFCLGYPNRLEANGIGFPVARGGTVASFPVTPTADHPTFMMDYTTYEGDSGGPVFATSRAGGGGALIVGVVIERFHANEKTETSRETREVRHPLHLAKVVQASYLLDTLKLAKAPPGEG